MLILKIKGLKKGLDRVF